MKRSKLICALLAAALALVLAVACTPAPEPEAEVTPVDFADASVTVEYGDDYDFSSLLNVKGSDGETYRATAKVTTTAGETVTVVNGSFRADNLGGYKVTLTVDTGKTYTRTITVNVTRYTIELSGYNENGYPRGEVAVPTATVRDKDGTAMDVEVSYTVTDKAGNPVTVTDGKINAPLATTYTVSYVASANGKELKKTIVLAVVRDAAADNEIESYDCVEALEGTRALWSDGATTEITWLDNFEGESGVVKFDYSESGGGWPSFTWTSRHSLDDYAEYDYIVVRAYFTDCEGKVLRAVMGGGDYHIEPIDATGYVHDGAVNSGDYHMAYNGWKNYVYPIRNFIDAWKTGDVTFGRWLMAGNSGSGILYVSSIYAAKKQDVTVTGGENAKVGDEITLNVTSGDVTCTLTVVDPDGNKVTVADNKFTAEQAGKYYVRAEYVSGGVTVYGLGTLEIEVKALADFRAKAFTGTAIVGTAITVPGAELISGGATVETVETAKSVTYGGVAVALTDNKTFTPNAAGDYVVNYEVVHEGRTYTVSQTIAVSRKAAAANEIESFDDPSSVNNIVAYWNSGLSATKTWMPSFEGETNVVKIEYSENGGGWPSLTWTARHDLDHYAEYDYIVVRAYFADCTGKITRATMGGGDYHIEPIDATGYVHDGSVDSGDYHFTYDGWKNYVYPVANFINAWKAGGGVDKWLMHGESGDGVLYISSIYAAKKQDVTVTGGENAKVGDEITLSVTSGDVTCTLTVVDPDGNAVTVTNGKFTAEKAGKYYVRAEYVGSGVTVYGLGTTEITVAAA